MVKHNFLKYTVDLRQPLNSAEGLKKLWINWTLLGVHMPDNKNLLWRILYSIYTTFILCLCAVVYPVSIFLYIWHMKSWEDAVNNLSLSASIIISFFKQVGIIVHRHRMAASEKYLRPLDERCNQHSKDRLTILNAIRKCNVLFTIYFSVYFLCSFGFSCNAWISRQLSYDAVLPTFSDNEETNLLVVLAFQTFCQTYTCAQASGNDVYPLCYLTLIHAHLDALADRIKRIGFEPSDRIIEENTKELKRCIMDHKNLVNFFEHIQPAISTTLFLQFFVTAFVVCLTIIKMIAFNINMAEYILSVNYLVILMFQVFPCCWYVNILMEKSDYLTTAIYSCNWMEQNQKFRKILIIFMQRSQRKNTILAGNLVPVTVQTFLSIIRFSFSVYMLLSRMYD